MAEKLNWSANLDRLDEILKNLESGSLPLDEALDVFEKGIRLLKESQAFLEAAEQRVTLLTQEGEEVPFEKLS